MGRYDTRFKAYHGGAFKNVQQLRVWNGSSWVDFGNNDSSNVRSLYVRNASGGNSRVTRNREVYTIPGELYGEGQFTVLPAGNFQFYNYSSGPRGTDFNFNGTFRKVSGGDLDLYYSYYTPDPNHAYIRITWMNDGRIRIMTKYGSYSSTVYSTNAVGTGQWVHIKVYSSVSDANNRIHILFNGSYTTNLYALCAIMNSNNVHNIVLSGGIHFKDTLTISGSNYAAGSATTQSTRNITPYGSGGSSGQWTAFTKVDTSSQGVRWV